MRLERPLKLPEVFKTKNQEILSQSFYQPIRELLDQPITVDQPIRGAPQSVDREPIIASANHLSAIRTTANQRQPITEIANQRGRNPRFTETPGSEKRPVRRAHHPLGGERRQPIRDKAPPGWERATSNQINRADRRVWNPGGETSAGKILKFSLHYYIRQVDPSASGRRIYSF